jgi:hypothetical protein
MGLKFTGHIWIEFTKTRPVEINDKLKTLIQKSFCHGMPDSTENYSLLEIKGSSFICDLLYNLMSSRAVQVVAMVTRNCFISERSATVIEPSYVHTEMCSSLSFFRFETIAQFYHRRHTSRCNAQALGEKVASHGHRHESGRLCAWALARAHHTSAPPPWNIGKEPQFKIKLMNQFLYQYQQFRVFKKNPLISLILRAISKNSLKRLKRNIV